MIELLLSIGQSAAVPASAYLGEVTAAELITGSALASAIGLTIGTGINDASGWLKFSVDETILYIAKKPFRYSVAWVDLNSKGAVFGTVSVDIGGMSYKVRLPTGATMDPALSSDPGGEWNELMYPIHISHPDGRNWASFTDGDLSLAQGMGGEESWCQETYSANTAQKFTRGGGGQGLGGSGGITNIGVPSGGSRLLRIGWRPVLELVS